MGFLDRDLLRYFDLRLLRLLWLADAFLVGLWLCLGVLVLLNAISSIPDIFSIARDWSVPEISNYVKWAAVIVLLITSSLKSTQSWPAILAIGFLIILADDALQIHERYTSLVHGIWPSIAIGSAVAQAIIFCFLGLLVLLFLALAWHFAGKRDRFRVTFVFGLIVAIAFFAIIVDLIHGILGLSLVGDVLLVLAEDGSELFLTSLILSFVYQSIWRELESRPRREFSGVSEKAHVVDRE